MSINHDYDKYAIPYSNLKIEGTFFLAFRDVPEIVDRYVMGKKALDYGCGTGRSTDFLYQLGLTVTGVDISHSMIEQAIRQHPIAEYIAIESGVIPFPAKSFDLVFSSFVFMEVSSKDEIERILRDMRRVLKPNGVVIFVVSVVQDTSVDWVSFTYDFPENKGKNRSGDQLKLLIKENNIVLFDYNWFDEDYMDVAQNAGFEVLQCYKPIGKDGEPYDWKAETYKEYFSVFVLKDAKKYSFKSLKTSSHRTLRSRRLNEND